MLQVGWLTSQTETISTVYANRSDGWASLDGRRNVPDWPIRDSVHHLLNSYCRNSTSNFAEGVRNTQCFSNPTRCSALNFFSDTDRQRKIYWRRNRFSPVHFSLHNFVHIHFTSPVCDRSFQKSFLFVAFELKITGENAFFF